MERTVKVLVVAVAVLTLSNAYTYWRVLQVQRAASVVVTKEVVVDEAKLEDLYLRIDQAISVAFEARLATSDKEVYLMEVDQALSDSARGRPPIGSVTDWILPAIVDAKTRGATAEEINRRLDRLLELAKEGKQLSSFAYENPTVFREEVESHRMH
jgi:hypothetical protein